MIATHSMFSFISLLTACFFDACKVEEPETEYERQRAHNIMRNNLVARSLGIDKLTSLLKQSSKLRKTKGRAAHNEDTEGLPGNNLPMHTIQSGGKRSKRVMAFQKPRPTC